MAAPHLGRPAGWLLAVVTALAGVERVHIGAHRPLDVVTGFGLGVVVGRVVRHLTDG